MDVMPIGMLVRALGPDETIYGAALGKAVSGDYARGRDDDAE